MQNENLISLGTDFGVKSGINAFKTGQLADETSVRVIDVRSKDAPRDQFLCEKDLDEYLEQVDSVTAATFFINRHLVKNSEPWPTDANKLRLSQHSFETLRSHFHLSSPFLNALANIHHVSPRYIPRQWINSSTGNFDFWFFVPVRVQVPCLNVSPHRSGSKAKSQMNPLSYLHLTLPGVPDVDIRGCKIAVYYTYKVETAQAFSFVFNFQDGRWKKVAEEPILRLKDMVRSCPSPALGRDPVYLHMAILNCVLRWWDNALNSVNDQLIAFEEELIQQDLKDEDLSSINAQTNQSLHCMAAHLHRYGSELQSLSDLVQDINLYNSRLHEEFVGRGLRQDISFGSIATTLDQTASHLSAISGFRHELQQKIDNILALLVDNTKAMNDRLLVQNSKAMQEILEVSQAEAESSRQIAVQSKRLSEEMMKDSVAMKTVALLTIFFLPGTSYAAVLAMPFFGKDEWMSSTRRIWVWVVLTIPTTLLCFWVYRSWTRRESERKTISTQDLEMQSDKTPP